MREARRADRLARPGRPRESRAHLRPPTCERPAGVRVRPVPRRGRRNSRERRRVRAMRPLRRPVRRPGKRLRSVRTRKSAPRAAPPVARGGRRNPDGPVRRCVSRRARDRIHQGRRHMRPALHPDSSGRTREGGMREERSGRSFRLRSELRNRARGLPLLRGHRPRPSRLRCLRPRRVGRRLESRCVPRKPRGCGRGRPRPDRRRRPRLLRVLRTLPRRPSGPSIRRPVGLARRRPRAPSTRLPGGPRRPRPLRCDRPKRRRPNRWSRM